MSQPIYLQIIRTGTEGQAIGFLVKVYRHNLETGYAENGEGDESQYPLSLREEEEALALFEQQEQRFTTHGRFIPFEPPLCGPSANEYADRAEANWSSERMGR